MIRKLIASVALAGVALGAAAQQKLVPAGSEIAFTSRQMGVPVEGKFRKFDAQIAFDPKQPAAAKVAFTVDLASVSFGAAETETEVAKPDWFNTKAFPQASFQSTSVTATGPNRFDVAGRLSIKGATQDVVVPITLTQAGGTTTATGGFTLKRQDFKIGDGDWKDTSMVANEVQVRLKLALTGVAPL